MLEKMANFLAKYEQGYDFLTTTQATLQLRHPNYFHKCTYIAQRKISKTARHRGKSLYVNFIFIVL